MCRRVLRRSTVDLLQCSYFELCVRNRFADRISLNLAAPRRAQQIRLALQKLSTQAANASRARNARRQARSSVCMCMLALECDLRANHALKIPCARAHTDRDRAERRQAARGVGLLLFSLLSFPLLSSPLAEHNYSRRVVEKLRATARQHATPIELNISFNLHASTCFHCVCDALSDHCKARAAQFVRTTFTRHSPLERHHLLHLHLQPLRSTSTSRRQLR